MLRYDLEDKKRTFFNFRRTGASHIAQCGRDRDGGEPRALSVSR